VIDGALRVHKEAVLGPLARRTPRRVHPTAVTLAGLVPGLGAAAAAAAGRPLLALVLWLVNRLLDGLDGTIARLHGRQSDLGGYLDILADFVVYAAVPLGVAAGAGDRETWAAVAVMLAAFYVNAISWAYLSAVLERRAEAGGRLTTLAMPTGLVEGAETVVLFAFLVAVPAWAVPLAWGIAVGVAVTAAQRVVWAIRTL
jgi:phosphatidylglycerophosphate synthase